MILESIPYYSLSKQPQSAAGACLAMTLGYFREAIDPVQAQELYQHIFPSATFYNWYLDRHNLAEDVNHVVYACMQYIVEEFFEEYDAAIVTTPIDRIKYSYLKRQIPVIMHGRFPVGVSTVPHTILVRGYVDDYLVVNDPRGNMRSAYADKHGELLLYSETEMARCCAASDQMVSFLRIIKKDRQSSGI